MKEFPAGNSNRRRRPRDELEEGEIVDPGYEYSGSDTEDDEDDDGRYEFKARGGRDDGRPEIKRRRLEDIADAPPSPTSSSGSDRTISDDSVGAAPAPKQPKQFFPCFPRAFLSNKGTRGHMKIHGPRGRHRQDKEPMAATSKVGGFVGYKAMSVDDEEVGDSMAIVVADTGLPVLDPIPMAYARPVHESFSVKQDLNELPLAEDHMILDQPDAPLVDGSQPAGAAEERCKPAPPAQQEGWCCKEEGCNKRYATHQALGGHMAGHKNRKNQAAAAEPGGSLPGPKKEHKCKDCGIFWPSGVALGGHMRMHFKGQLRQKKRDPVVEAPMAVQESIQPAIAEIPEVALTLSLQIVPAMGVAQAAVAQELPIALMAAQESLDPVGEEMTKLTLALPGWQNVPAVEVKQAAPASVNEAVEPATAPDVAGAVMIFGVIIGLKAPSGEEVPSTVTGGESSATANDS